jgi:hypothetical protein
VWFPLGVIEHVQRVTVLHPHELARGNVIGRSGRQEGRIAQYRGKRSRYRQNITLKKS